MDPKPRNLVIAIILLLTCFAIVMSMAVRIE